MIEVATEEMDGSDRVSWPETITSEPWVGYGNSKKPLDRRRQIQSLIESTIQWRKRQARSFNFVPSWATCQPS